MNYTITAVDRALALLEVIAEHPGSRVSDLAALTGQTKSLIFRMIYTLEQRGYVIRDPASRTYTLGFHTIYLGARAQGQTALLRAAAPIMDELLEASRENVNLLVREGHHSVCVALRPSPLPVRLYAQVGRRGPLHAGGGPGVLLAHAPAEVQDAVMAGPLESYTATTVTDPARLRAMLQRIRNAGGHESRGDLDPESFSFAAPVFAREGEVLAALSIAGPASRLTEERARAYRELVSEGAARLSLALGFRPALRATG